MRIIGGVWRSRILKFPDRRELRPTPDRVRETLFNWLGQDLSGRSCLDLFAGSGALGFEALSRGAESVVMVERDRDVWRALTANAARLGAEKLDVLCADALKFITSDTRRYDVIFLDPPFNEAYMPKLEAHLAQRLSDAGLVYVESGEPPRLGPHWQTLRKGRAGRVDFRLFTRAEA